MIIDFHCHFSQWGGVRIPEDTPQRTLEMLGSVGVDGALIAPLMGLFSSCTDVSIENNEIYEYCREAPGRLFPAFAVNPLMGKCAIDEIKRCYTEHGTKVLKLHPWLQGFSLTCPEMNATAEVCEELGISILFHDGTPVYSNPMQVARLCRDFPKLTVIAGHAGLSDLCREAMIAAERYSNYVLCFCGPREAMMREIIANVSPKQICVGSDLSTSDKDDAVLWFRWRTFRELDIPGDVRRTIEQDTPARLLGLN